MSRLATVLLPNRVSSRVPMFCRLLHFFALCPAVRAVRLVAVKPVIALRWGGARVCAACMERELC